MFRAAFADWHAMSGALSALPDAPVVADPAGTGRDGAEVGGAGWWLRRLLAGVLPSRRTRARSAVTRGLVPRQRGEVTSCAGQASAAK